MIINRAGYFLFVEHNTLKLIICSDQTYYRCSSFSDAILGRAMESSLIGYEDGCDYL